MTLQVCHNFTTTFSTWCTIGALDTLCRKGVQARLIPLLVDFPTCALSCSYLLNSPRLHKLAITLRVEFCRNCQVKCPKTIQKTCGCSVSTSGVVALESVMFSLFKSFLTLLQHFTSTSARA